MPVPLLHRRQARPSHRGLYLQDRILTATRFQPGQPFRYWVDPTARQIVLVPAATGVNTVSARHRADTTLPVIDVRTAAARTLVSTAAYLDVAIYPDRIVVTAYGPSDHAADVPEQMPSAIISLAAWVAARPLGQVVVARDALRAAVGSSQLAWVWPDEPGPPPPPDPLSALPRAIGLPFRVASLFSGAGLLDWAFAQAGFAITFAVEKNPEAALTYRENLGPHIRVADVRDVVPYLGPASVIIGGPPCQGFSSANRHSHYLDNPNNLLMRAFIHAVQSVPGCQVFVIENVPQLLTAGHGRFLHEIEAALCDFTIRYGVLDAADFGTPQVRKRAILIGSKIGPIDLPTPSGAPTPTVRAAFAGLTPTTPNQPDVSTHSALTLERMRHVPPGGNVWDIPAPLRPKGTHSDLYRRLVWDRPSCTIVHPRKAVLTHPAEDRILSVRECARLQGLPDSFVFHGPLNSRQQQVANGVPVPLGRAVAERVMVALQQALVRERRPVMA